MGSSKFHALRKLVSPSKPQQFQDDPNDDMSMVGRSEVPVCLSADRPPAHLLQSLDSRGSGSSARPASASGSSPPLSPRSHRRMSGAGAAAAGAAAAAAAANHASMGRSSTSSGGNSSPVSALPPDSPLSGYRRSPVPEPIMEVDEDEGAEKALHPVDAVAPAVAVRPAAAPVSLESTANPDAAVAAAESAADEGGDEAMPPLTTSPSVASSFTGRSSSESAELRGVAPTALPLTADENSRKVDPEALVAGEAVYAGLS